MAGLDLSMSSSCSSTVHKSLLSTDDHIDMDISSPSKSRDVSPMSTPRKNKRKSSSPKRRTDFSIKRFCPDTAHALNLETEELSTRPGYGEHPPSTPEMSASSSTPSPPDAAELRIPHVPRNSIVTSPRRHMMSTSPPRNRSPSVNEQTIPRAGAHLLPPYAMSNPAFLAMNPLLIQHMVGLQQHAALPLVLQHPQLSSATAPLPIAHHPSTQTHAQSIAVHAQARSHPQQIVNNHFNHPAKHASSSQSKQMSVSAAVKASSKTVSSTRPRPAKSKANDSHDFSKSSNNDSALLSTSALSDPSFHSDNEEEDDGEGGKRRKNYKNMTRERRIEANARERSRVHTISAAFETLRHTVPSFSHNQRLSKLAILRIACSYIASLSTLAGNDYSYGEGSSRQPSFEESVNQCTKTIQNEGRAKRRH